MIGLAVALTAYLVVCLVLISERVPLGHDEAVYSARAREMSLGQPANPWWGAYRAPGLPLILTLAFLGKGTELDLRLVVVAVGGTLIVFTWLLGRLMVGRGGSLAAVFGVALTPVILSSVTQVWPDVPAAAVGMAALYCYGYGLCVRRMPWWVVLAVPILVALATTIRYGAPIPLAIGLAALTFWRMDALSENRMRIALIAVGVATTVALTLMTPLLTGAATPFDTLSALSSDIPPAQGFSDYWGLRWSLTSGSVAVGLVAVVVGAILSIVDRTVRRHLIWPLGIGVVTFLALAVSVHGEARYLAPVYPWFWLAAGVGLVALARLIPRQVAYVAAAIGIIAFATLALELSDGRNRFNEGFATIRAAASSLDMGGKCGVFTGYAPQVEWYSNCESVGIDRTSVVTESPFLPAGPRYLFIVEGGKRQPSSELMEAYLQETTGAVSTIGVPGQKGRFVEVWTLPYD